MQEFKNYIIQEFRDLAPNYAAVEFKFNHSTKTKFEKKTDKKFNIDIIKVGVRFYDKDLTELTSQMIQFDNNEISVNKAKSLVKITREELNNKFKAARNDICKEIAKEYSEKLRDFNDRMKILNDYNVIIETNPPPQTTTEISIKPEESKQKFDM